MVSHRLVLAAAAFACTLAATAHANPVIPALTTAIPEPSDFVLFLMGVAGLIIGRRSARRRHRRDDDTKA
jgi:predicted histidine transporter YuiF (NhaC family)